MFHGKIPIWNVFWHLCGMRLTILLLGFFGQFAYGQSYFSEHVGGMIGLVANVGTHNTSIGITGRAYFKESYFQVNTGSTFLLYQNALAGRTRMNEWRHWVGLVLVAGKENRAEDFQLDGLNHQTQRDFGVGFNYLWYVDSKHTGQASGGFAVHLKNLSIYHENDIFSGSGRDRFRTGQFHVSYMYQDYKFFGGIQLWTGESKNAPLLTEGCDHCPAGYRDLQNTPYGKTSHGIAYFGITRNAFFNNYASFKVGMDSEQIRHVVQNRFIHNLGEWINRPTPHYLRLDSNGLPTFDKANMRPNRLFLELSTNECWAY